METDSSTKADDLSYRSRVLDRDMVLQPTWIKTSCISTLFVALLLHIFRLTFGVWVFRRHGNPPKPKPTYTHHMGMRTHIHTQRG
mmetsp:Transcript_52773/g.87682  ORF Transcript_52773/g.87682 Transcript_52773/m.87682 type:complete len:85 (-) Transcript_52773:534-788(-)